MGDSATTLLRGGYLSTKGSQFVDAAGNPVRIASVGWPWNQGSWNVDAEAQKIVQAGFNTVRVSWVNANLSGDLSRMDLVVAAAKKVGLKVIFDNHTNEPGHGPQDNYGAQQKNGLWYDLGGATDNTDGGGNPGTVTDQRFLQDWVKVAQHFAGNDTVIGYDIRNEPLAYNGMSTWGDGNINTDIRLMYQRVGNAIQAVDANKLIICEGPQNYSGNFAGTGPAPQGDLSTAGRKPVSLNVPNKVVYSVHEYPQYVSGFSPDSGSAKVAQMNQDWGYLVSQNIAPVWIGEMGASFDGSYNGENVAASKAWAQTLLDYMNGKSGALGGPTFSGNQQGVSGDWWQWGYVPGDVDGTLDANGNLRADQQAYFSQMLMTSNSIVEPPPPISVGTGPDKLLLKISGDAYANGDGTSDAAGHAAFTVKVDGKQIGGTFTALASHAAGQTQNFTLSGYFGTGAHTVVVNFLNDAWGGTATSDRNFYVDGVSYLGANTSQTASLLSTGTATFSVSGGTSGGPTVTNPPNVTVGTGPDQLVLKISGDAYANGDGTSDAAGHATFIVKVDGKQIGTNFTALASHAAGQTQNFILNGSFGTGAHSVAVTFLNDAWGGTATSDRNLYVDAVSYLGANMSQTANLLSAGTSTFNINGGTQSTDPDSPLGTVIGSGSDTIVLKVSEDATAGVVGLHARFTLNVDGKQIGPLQTASKPHGSGQFDVFTFKGNYAPGPHDITVTFANNFLMPGESGDRNLYVEGLTYNGQVISNTTTGIYESPVFPPNSSDGNHWGNAVFRVNDSTAIPAGAPSTPTTTPGPVAVGSGPDKLVLQMAEDPYQGDAKFTVKIDGQQVGGELTTTAHVWEGQRQEFDIFGNFGPGQHTVAVTFTNNLNGANYPGTDLAIDTTDRNLYVMGLSLNGGSAAAGAPWELDSNGSHSFTVTSGSVTPLVTPSPDDTVITAASAQGITDAKGNVWTIKSGQVAVNGAVDATTAGVKELAFVKGTVWQENTANLWWGKTSPTASWSPTAGTAAPPIRITATSAGVSKTIDATVAHTETDYGASINLSAPGVAAATVGTTAVGLSFINHTQVSVTGGTAAANIALNTGALSLSTGKGAMNVTGGTGVDTYAYHAGSGKLTIADFSLAQGDALKIDKALQGAMTAGSDGAGGTLLSFGTLAAGIDLKGITSVPTTAMHWV